MQLTRAADYALRVLLHLAQQPPHHSLSRAALAQAVAVPDSFLSKILQKLARAGLIEARRGVEGGFFLLERGRRASVLEVVETIDGPLTLNQCIAPGPGCVRQDHCAAHGVWQQAQQAMVAVLQQARIAELASAERARGLASLA